MTKETNEGLSQTKQATCHDSERSVCVRLHTQVILFALRCHFPSSICELNVHAQAVKTLGEVFSLPVSFLTLGILVSGDLCASVFLSALYKFKALLSKRHFITFYF